MTGLGSRGTSLLPYVETDRGLTVFGQLVIEEPDLQTFLLRQLA